MDCTFGSQRLGAISFALDRYSEAKYYFSRALALREKELAHDIQKLLQHLNSTRSHKPHRLYRWFGRFIVAAMEDSSSEKLLPIRGVTEQVGVFAEPESSAG